VSRSTAVPPQLVFPDGDAIIVSRGLTFDGEHAPLFSDVDMDLGPGLHAVHMPGGHSQKALLLTLAGRLKPSAGTVAVFGETAPRAIRKHCAIAAFGDIDDLDEAVTVGTVVTEQRRWLAPLFRRSNADSGRDALAEVFGDIERPAPTDYIGDLDDLETFLLQIALALCSDRPVLVVGDLEQVRDNARRAQAVQRLGALAAERLVVVGVTNSLGVQAPEHEVHIPNMTGRD
jgi:ABC-type multidrug transport system ATPase subunit